MARRTWEGWGLLGLRQVALGAGARAEVEVGKGSQEEMSGGQRTPWECSRPREELGKGRPRGPSGAC